MWQDSSSTIQQMQAAAQQCPELTFGLAGVLMLVGLAVYLLATKGGESDVPD